MNSFICLGLTVLFIVSTMSLELRHPKKIVCSWNSEILDRRMLNELEIKDLRPALSHCTHLIYRYPGIKLENPRFGDFIHRLITHVKRNFPDLKVYLGIGGNQVPYETTFDYLFFIKTTRSRTRLINWVHNFLLEYNFDGIDLAWQFPTVKKEDNSEVTYGRIFLSIFRTIWYEIKKNLGGGDFEDENIRLHREGFTQLVRELRADQRLRLKDLTLTVLPNVNVPVFYAPRLLARHIEAVHLMPFNPKTLKRNPEEIFRLELMYGSPDLVLLNSIDFHTSYWLENGTPDEKIVFGIPIRVSCILNVIKKYPNHPYLYYQRSKIAVKISIVHEDPVSFEIEESCVRRNRLGGIAILDLTYDDFNGICT